MILENLLKLKFLNLGIYMYIDKYIVLKFNLSEYNLGSLWV